jgi:probable HAF family extracellular repeat protein
VGTFEGGGFELIGSTYKRIFFPGAMSTGVFGIAASGEVVGLAGKGSSSRIFLFAHREYRLVSIRNAPNAAAFGISTAPDILVGSYPPTPTTMAGFVYRDQTLVTLQFPASNFTTALGTNDTGQVVGWFTDAQGNVHGFLWTPPADVVKK